MLNEKYIRLKNILKDLGSVTVAYSSGVDSTFLLKAAYDTLGIENVTAATVASCSFPKRELAEATEFCKKHGVNQVVIDFDILSIEGFCANPSNRCYICKKALFKKIMEVSDSHGRTCVVEGSNVDDDGDYRPGLMAIAELGIASPLKAAGLTKAEIRQLSEQLGLDTFAKPSFACLSSRFPYGQTITAEKLAMVDAAEQLLMDMGFEQFRVRIHGENNYVARIEVMPDDIERIASKDVRDNIYQAFKKYGFSYISLDLKGYRTGSMNEVL